MPAFPETLGGGQLVIGLWPVVNPMCAFEGRGAADLWLPGPLRGSNIETPDGVVTLPRKRGQHPCTLYCVVDPDVDVNGDPLPGGQAGLFHNIRAMSSALIDPMLDQEGDGTLPAVWTPYTGADDYEADVQVTAITAGDIGPSGWFVTIDLNLPNGPFTPVVESA